jgi:hypothetical protein
MPLVPETVDYLGVADNSSVSSDKYCWLSS